MDEMRFIDMGGEMAPQIAALKGGEVDLIDASDNPGPQIMQAVKGDGNVKVLPVATATTRVLRMRVDLGVTPWTHRPLGTMVPNLAYVADEQGKPVPWNETRWVDEEYSRLLAEASGTLDVAERKKLFCRLEEIQLERGSIGIAYWMNTWMVPNKRLKNVEAHPNLLLLFNEAWLDS